MPPALPSEFQVVLRLAISTIRFINRNQSSDGFMNATSRSLGSLASVLPEQ